MLTEVLPVAMKVDRSWWKVSWLHGKLMEDLSAARNVDASCVNSPSRTDTPKVDGSSRRHNGSFADPLTAQGKGLRPTSGPQGGPPKQFQPTGRSSGPLPAHIKFRLLFV